MNHYIPFGAFLQYFLKNCAKVVDFIFFGVIMVLVSTRTKLFGAELVGGWNCSLKTY
jgi:hypothetical protein